MFAPLVRQLLDVAQGAAHVGLEDDADVAVPVLQLAVDAERRVRRRMVLHVDADEIAEAFGGLDDARDVVAAEPLVDLEAPGG